MRCEHAFAFCVHALMFLSVFAYSSLAQLKYYHGHWNAVNTHKQTRTHTRLGNECWLHLLWDSGPEPWSSIGWTTGALMCDWLTAPTRSDACLVSLWEAQQTLTHMPMQNKARSLSFSLSHTHTIWTHTNNEGKQMKHTLREERMNRAETLKNMKHTYKHTALHNNVRCMETCTFFPH